MFDKCVFFLFFFLVYVSFSGRATIMADFGLAFIVESYRQDSLSTKNNNDQQHVVNYR